ncbi:MAG TPA: SLC13 family permease [Candidatus Binataceae bacterium]|nr:SLC13 family permease [Candidatus Binataceae bacterium]
MIETDLRLVSCLAIFLFTYLVLGIGRIPILRIDRTGAAMVGGVAMVVFGFITSSRALAAIDFPTLALLFGMMIVVANLRITGVFSRIATMVFLRARTGYGLLAVTVALSGTLAAFFINDVVCLVFTPVVLDAAEAVEADPRPFLLGLAVASNIGSAATITGNPQNMIVAGFAHLDYLKFALRLAPAAIAGLAAAWGIIATIYRSDLGPHRTHPRHSPAHRRATRVPRSMMIKPVAVALATLVGFATGFPTHLVALSAAAILLMTRRIKPHRVYGEIDWPLLLMFAGLFVVVAGAETTGIDKQTLAWIGRDRLSHPITLAAVVAILSNIVSNVPAVLLFKPIYPMLARPTETALILASVSTYAGNLTVLGSIANLIVVENARRRGIAISFGEYAKVGIPITIATIAIDLLFLR